MATAKPARIINTTQAPHKLIINHRDGDRAGKPVVLAPRDRNGQYDVTADEMERLMKNPSFTTAVREGRLELRPL